MKKMRKSRDLEPGDVIQCRDIIDYLWIRFMLRRNGYRTEHGRGLRIVIIAGRDKI